MSKASPYQGAQIFLPTLHQKERVIAPEFRRILQANVVLLTVDTDSFGTFSGETPRVGTPEDAVVKKLEATRAHGADYAIATEGSFGPHPSMPFLACHHEIVAFRDYQRDVTIFEKDIFLKVVFGSIDITRIEEADDFLRAMRFGSYKMIVQSVTQMTVPAVKGISRLSELGDAIRAVQQSSCSDLIRISTDMRAHANPLRMWRIRTLARRLARRLLVLCPQCSCPGYGQISQELGLPCSECGMETDEVAALVYGCPKCQHTSRIPRLDGRTEASPGNCSWCNP